MLEVKRPTNAECGVRNAECGIKEWFSIPHSALRTPHSALLSEPVNPLPRRRRRQHVDFSLFVLAEGERRQAAVLDRAVRRDSAFVLVVLQGPDLCADVVAVQVHAVELRQARAAVDGAADDRLTDVVVVFPDRVNELVAGAGALR